MNITAKLLTSISAVRPTTVPEVWDGMGYDRPATMNEVNATLRMFESFEEQGLVHLKRGANQRIATLQLTPLGHERAQEAMEGAER